VTPTPTDDELALVTQAVRDLYRNDPERWGPAVIDQARQARGNPPVEPPRPEAGGAPRVGPDADDATAYDAVRRCPHRCHACSSPKCVGGLRDGQSAKLTDCLPCVRRPEESESVAQPTSSLPVRMVAPGERRPVWRGGVIQLQVTRACDLACHHCTQGSNLAGKPVVMTPDEFERAVKSLEGYWGVVGMFGGNPAMHPQFETLCEILRAHVPWEQRGIWCNHPRGKGRTMAITFNPAHSNLNVHLDGEAHAEFARDWPECRPHLKGLDLDSEHGSPWVALKDVVPDEAERWKLIGQCDVNRYWSALVGVVPGRGLRAYFCEIAYAQAALHATASDAADWPDTGLVVAPGWWRLPMADFADQVRLHCHACGIPLRRKGQLAVGGELEEFSETHRSIARPKAKGRPVEIVESIGLVERPARPATEYLPGTTPRVHA
jgi:hypothetical protein